MDPVLRYLAPRDHDRVNELVKKYGYKLPNITTQIQVLKIIKDSKKYLEMLEKIERQAAKHAGFNFFLKNIPDQGPLRSNGMNTKIGYAEMNDTLNQFGAVHCIDIIRGTVYATIDNPMHCHNLVNHMQMGTNILTSNVF
jgi:hypothetical protein